jgi:hypothetical protein
VAEQRRMPPIAFALLGVTVGGPLVRSREATPEPLPPGTPSARVVLALLMLGPAAAEAAVPVIEDRLATQSSAWYKRPFADVFSGWTVRAAADAPVVLIELTLGRGTSADGWLDLVRTHDLGFVAW